MNKRRADRRKERLGHKEERYWRQMIGEQADSGQSVRAFCQEKQLIASVFFSWQRKLKQRDQKQLATEAAALPRHDAKALEGSPTSWIVTEERYRLTDSTAVRVEIETGTGGEGKKLDVELVDISQGGVRLRSKKPVAEKAELTMTIVPTGFPKSLSARARVCWTTLAPKSSYWLGCSIEPRIPQALLDHLAANGILERRHDSRQEVSMTLSACWELDPTTFEVSILNISRGGICLLISQDGHPGDRIRLTLPGDSGRPAYILTTVCWQVETEDGYVVGCSFCHQASYEKLLHLAGAQTPQS
jgi:hypothetical protein